MAPTISTLSCGMLFGAALTASGVYDPRVIVSQLKMQDFHMLQTFMTASATGAAAIAILQGTNYLRLSAKKAVPLGSASKYGGNIVGGILIGVGMALSGACPGTVLVQAVQGIPSGIYAALGAFLGGFAYSALSRILPLGKDAPSPSVAQELGISSLSAFIGYELVCGAVLGLSTLAPKTSRWPVDPIIGGLIIGGAQTASLLLRKSTVGVSSVFGDAAENTITFLSTAASKEGKKSYAVSATQFAAGLMAGSYFLTALRPELVASSSMVISPLRAILGGAVMSIGSRQARGCTSGQSMSGMSQLSIASFVTTAAIFAGGMATCLFV